MQVAIRISENDGPPTAMHFAAPSVLLVGRHSDCDLRLEGDLVSRKHARIMLGSTAFIVEDLSANGTEVPPSTKLHGERKELEYGSLLRIGPFSLTVGDVGGPPQGRAVPPPVPRRTAPPLPQPSTATLVPRGPVVPASSYPPPPVAPGALPTPHVPPSPPWKTPPPPRLGDIPLTDETFERALFGLFGAVRPLLDDPTVSLVMIDGPGRVSVEQRGEVVATDVRFSSPKSLFSALRAATQSAGRGEGDESPVFEAQLADGLRLLAILPPSGRGGPYVTLRKGSHIRLSLSQLVERGSLTLAASELLDALVACGQSVVVAGGGGAGKTSLLDALAALIPERERVIVVEEQGELELARGHLVTLEASPRAPVRQLLRAALGMRPDRVVIGELQGAEALDAVVAMPLGHGGLLTTVRATSPRDALARLEAMTLLADAGAPLAARRAQIAAAIRVVVQVARLRDGSRKVTRISEVAGFDLERGAYDVRDLYARTVTGADPRGQVLSELRPTGALPRTLEELLAEGYDLPQEMYEAAARLPAGGSAAPHP